MAFTPRIGVYICHCGVNIAGTVDVAQVADYAAGLPAVCVARHYTYMCSEPGQALIKEDISRLNLNRVVVASCSPLMHEPTFRAAIQGAGLNAYCLEMANIREQCSWVHAEAAKAMAASAGVDLATLKAMQLAAAAVAKARLLQPLATRQAAIAPAALVIGGGVAGMQAALDIADAGFHVYLVERQERLGGHLARFDRVFPTLQPARELLDQLVGRIAAHPRVTVFTASTVRRVEGYVGNFTAEIARHQAGEQGVPPLLTSISAGAIIVAAGFEAYDAHAKPELGYGIYPQVFTTLDLEEKLPALDLSRIRDIVFIQCVGSREGGSKASGAAHAYCSRVCCMETAKQARLLAERIPEARVTVFYMDVRAYGKGFEEFYDAARQGGVVYRRGNPAEILPRGGRLVVRAEDTLLGELVEVPADLVVLAVGMKPPDQIDQLAGLLKLARSADGFFLEAHPKLRPVETAVAGVFLAGCCQGPKDISETIAQARAAAAAALIPLMRGQVTVEAMTAFVEEELCAGCNQCAVICPYAALSLHQIRKVMTVNPVLCQGCGACAATCPSGAINLRQFTFDQVMAQVDALARPALVE